MGMHAFPSTRRRMYPRRFRGCRAEKEESRGKLVFHVSRRDLVVQNKPSMSRARRITGSPRTINEATDRMAVSGRTVIPATDKQVLGTDLDPEPRAP